MALNDDFRQADEVIIPPDTQFGWTDGTLSEQDALDVEKSVFDRLEADLPLQTRTREPRQFLPKIWDLFNQYQKSKGRYDGSYDWTLLDEFAVRKPLLWLPQIIGSCVISNTFRGWVLRAMIQIVMYGKAEEYLGHTEFASTSFAPYCPWSYGMMRRRGGLRRGDGGFCGPMAESLMKDGVLPCNTPALVELTKRLSVAGENDYPEPQGSRGAAVYRDFGNWQYLDELKQYADYPLLESVSVKDAGQLWELHKAGKPTFVCSMEAIHKIGEHRDGFAIHAMNPRDQWAHNMASHGCFVSSDGDRWFRWSNESWGERHLYNRSFDEVDKRLRSGRLEMRSIGEIQGPGSQPPLMA